MELVFTDGYEEECVIYADIDSYASISCALDILKEKVIPTLEEQLKNLSNELDLEY